VVVAERGCPPTLGENLLLTPPELGVQGAFAAIGSNICVSPIDIRVAQDLSYLSRKAQHKCCFTVFLL